ncbi:hypothetical protein FIBSPDRAFT_836390 [Athelia psychrophila]|uniref:NAD(P)-binding protein n=1 Tax=Athelia psychrophila TaxID=1759441 RepID=A0A166B748_9AGAM|nr:hypothetical protein FIBSPDRAFT_836390 [Fibularhizoctonia sp. CBS 109695]
MVCASSRRPRHSLLRQPVTIKPPFPISNYTPTTTGFTDLLTQSFPAKSKFKVEDIPDLSGKVALVTGANTGVGLEIAKVMVIAHPPSVFIHSTPCFVGALLSRNAKVYIASRNQKKAEAAIEHLLGATGKDAVFLKLDLATLGIVAEAAKKFLSRETELHMLFNNGSLR